MKESNLLPEPSLALKHTCNGVRELSDYLLETGKGYVFLGECTTDYLEAKFGELRQGFAGSYSITVENIIEKFNIQKKRLLLQLNGEVPSEEYPDHLCQKCSYVLNVDVCIVLDNIPDLEKSGISDCPNIRISFYRQSFLIVLHKFSHLRFNMFTTSYTHFWSIL